MLHKLLPAFLGNKNEREIHRIRPLLAKIQEIEDALQREPEEKLRELTRTWQSRLARYRALDLPARPLLETMDPAGLVEVAQRLEARFESLRGEIRTLPRGVVATPDGIEEAAGLFQETEARRTAARERYLDQILPEAYAAVCNAARRLCGRSWEVNDREMTWDMIPYEVQRLGGVALHRGMIAEMRTGEGKTLVATLPVYLNALAGLGVHVVTVNDYLARRDAGWMGGLFHFLGLTVGCITHDMDPGERREAYACDITYGTQAEFGFDYLRDNGVATRAGEQVQRGHHFALLDEVDSILIDEARTPLIITGPSPDGGHAYDAILAPVERLVKEQTRLCNSLADEVERLLASGDLTTAGERLFQLKLGQPRNRRFLRFMEQAELRRLVEKTSLSFQHGALRKDILRLKSHLFFTVDEKTNEADLLEKGRHFLAPGDPESFVLPDTAAGIARIESDSTLDPAARAAAKRTLWENAGQRAQRLHGISQLLRAYCLYEKDVHYVLREGKVVIIDESTGREMAGRRWSDGLHQAVEAKERVTIEQESTTYATITIQNYFRLYAKLAGMTGTATTAAAEFHEIYGLDVLPIPTHRPDIRVDEPDLIFRTRREKYAAVLAAVREAHEKGQPVLVGTASVEASETLSRMLKRSGVAHSVLNAKHHEREAAIIAEAGRRGAVTVSTNMAGRGTDIKLGPGVAELGGLLVIGTERHSSRRVDRQLRGRCSRQGDPGRTRFFLSLEDDLLRNHASPEQMASLVEQAGRSRLPALGALVESAQTRIEQRDSLARKRILEFDDVMNQQRQIVYGYRNDLLHAGDPRRHVPGLIGEVVPRWLERNLEGAPFREGLEDGLLRRLNSELPVNMEDTEAAGLDRGRFCRLLESRILAAYQERVKVLPGDWPDEGERQVLLWVVDHHWQDHLAAMDALREGVFLRAQGQKDPLVEFKNEAYGLFSGLMDQIREDSLRQVFRALDGAAAWIESAGNPHPATQIPQAPAATAPARNAPCPCGSGRKSKHCCSRASTTGKHAADRPTKPPAAER